MGKGGESNETTPSSAIRLAKLGRLSEDELRRWAAAYGVAGADKAKKDTLLELLVSNNF
jgi:hypothetical protein